MSTLENISRQEVQTEAANYLEYHEDFKQKSICEKLWLIALSLPSYMFYTYLAGESDRYVYAGLTAFLNRTRAVFEQ